MTDTQRQLVESLRKMDVHDIGALSLKTIHTNIQQLIDVINNLQAKTDLMPPVGMNQVLRVQGSHDSMIPPNDEIGC